MNTCLYMHYYNFKFRTQHEQIYQKIHTKNNRNGGGWYRRVCLVLFCRLYKRHLSDYVKPFYQHSMGSSYGLVGS